MTELDPRFKIRAPLRCDGIGRLDCAEDLVSGMRMAVRWLPLEANGFAAANACEKLPDHPTLPRIRQTGQVGASAYVAMDFPDGNLLSTCIGEALDGATLIGITAQIADALATIHSQGVFHGEMSADSVLLVKSPSEKAYLWDMPLVVANRLTDRRGEERLMQHLVKTAPFLSPERARGGRTSAEADVYALGSIICVAGGAPLPLAESTLQVVHAVASGTWVPRVPKSVPEPLRSMLERMISREISARPTAREVVELFMPPVASTPTLREMAAVVLPLTPKVPEGKPVDPRLTRPTAPAMPVLLAPQAAELALSLREAAAAAEIAKLEAKEPLAAPVPMLSEEPTTTPGGVPTVASPSVAAPGVHLTENLAVSADLMAAGAAVMTPEQAAAMTRPNRRAPLLVAAVMAVLVVVLSGLVVDLARQPMPVTPVAPAPAVNQALQPIVMPVLEAPAPAAVVSDDELLTPLSPKAKRPVARKRPVRSAEQDSVAAPAAAAPQPGDFGFLEDEQELKRPSL